MDKRDETSETPGGAGAAIERHRTPYGSVTAAHASDLTVELRGHSAPDLFRLAAWALARTQVPDPDGDPAAEDVIELEADGWDDLLVNWMNQLLFLTERHRAVTEVAASPRDGGPRQGEAARGRRRTATRAAEVGAV